MQMPARYISLQLPRKMAFGAGCLAAAADWIARTPASVFIVTSPQVTRLSEPLVAALRIKGIPATVWNEVRKEPHVEDLARGLAAARDSGAGLIVGLGGGSAMDVAKLVAALLDGRQRIAEIFGIGNLAGRAAPLVCVPTTSGTGSEVSPIAIVQDSADGLKKGVISPHLVPDAAFVDPELTVGMPPAVTAATGLDALTHCIEAYANRQAHPLVDTWALEGIRRIARSLAAAYADGADLEARSDVALGSLYGGLCLGPVNTAAVHALAYPLGSDFGVAHGVSNAVLLAHVLEFNLPAAPQRYADIARAFGVAGNEPAEQLAARGIEAIRVLNRRCGIPAHVAELGVPESAIDRMAESALTVQRLLQQNPRTVTLQDARDIYRRAF
ncbi:MAG TPA: iron-containing alcohol dehydrogenase [Steroidobacteraceae bacterium]|nr:iron-containing alcohol dehydrogenase [Steroidobacteraceae bacterium]